MSNQGDSSEDNKRQGLIIAIIIISCVALFAIILVVALLLKKQPEPVAEDEEEARTVLVTEDNLGDVLGAHEAKAEDVQRAYYYTITMRDTTWIFKDGKSASPQSWVQNASNNDTDVYFDITRNDTGETIYSSPIIPIGQELNEVKLDKELPAGTYDCNMQYSLVDDDHKTVLSTVDLALTIVIQN